jgi:hypothetical protein
MIFAIPWRIQYDQTPCGASHGKCYDEGLGWSGSLSWESAVPLFGSFGLILHHKIDTNLHWQPQPCRITSRPLPYSRDITHEQSRIQSHDRRQKGRRIP